MAEPGGEYDIFLSHASPDKPWVERLKTRLEALGLRVWLDKDEIRAGDNWVIRLSDGLQKCRYMVLALSNHTADRAWVIQEWTSFMGGHGPLGRLLPIKIDAVDLPFILNATQTIDAIDRDVERAAAEIFRTVGDPSSLSSADHRQVVLGRDLVFTVSRDGDELVVVRPDGETRRSALPWKKDNGFGIAHMEFTKLHRQSLAEGPGRADLFRHARTLGGCLFDMLFDEADAAMLESMIGADRPRPVIQLRSGDPLLRSLPWELLYHGDRFLLREGAIDLVRGTTDEVDGATLLKKPSEPFKLVVNVSAPEGSKLDYEGESYRLLLALDKHCAIEPTELGTLDELIDTVYREKPQGIHFSGHGTPSALSFENDEGREDLVEVQDLIKKLRNRLPGDRRLPPFFYLASCYGNEPADLDEGKPGSDSAAMQLHQAGVSQVVGYFGPIIDELSTRAEEALYEAIASGENTRDAVHAARLRLAEPFHAGEGRHRPARDGLEEPAAKFEAAIDTHPFAWAQLVFYHRGPEWPLSIETPASKRQQTRALKRNFEGSGERRVLRAGFIGRRTEQHAIRRRLQGGAKVFVLQGLGGLGKSTLAQKILPWLTDDEANVCTLWCQEVEKTDGARADALVAQLLAYCRKRFGLDWEQVVQQVDRIAGDDPAQRFIYFLHMLVENAPGLTLYLDNLESLLNSPGDEQEEEAFGEWAEPALAAIWRETDRMARDSACFYLVASCRYRHPDFGDALLPVSPLPPDALFRLTAWFPSLQQLHAGTRARLTARLNGHPRAVEYADDLIAKALIDWKNRHGSWSLPMPATNEDIDREWEQLVEPALPKVADKLRDNLLLRAIWDNVLDQRARRFLYRITLLRRPADWSLLGLLGEEEEGEDTAFATAGRLRDTSLLEPMELFASLPDGKTGMVTRYALHPATAQFITAAHPADGVLLLAAHRRLGEHLETEAKTSPYLETTIEAGHHLFEAGDVDRAYELLGFASDWLQERGRVREGLKLLDPFLAKPLLPMMAPIRRGRLLGTIASCHHLLSEAEKAIGYNEQALTVFRKIGDQRGQATALGNLGPAYLHLGEVDRAISYNEQAQTIFSKIGDRQAEANSLSNLGNAYLLRHEVDQAIKCYQQQHAIAREIGSRKSVGASLMSLGTSYLHCGKAKKAIGYLKRHLAITRELGDRQGEANALGNLGIAHKELDELDNAIDYYEQQLVISREIGGRRGEGNALANLGNAYALLGEVEKANGCYQQALAIGRAIKDPRIVQVCEAGLGELSEQN